MQKYAAPDFEISVFELDDVLTISVGTGPIDGGDDGWVDV